MDKEEWEAFVKYWKDNWPLSSPDRITLDIYTDWKSQTNKGVQWVNNTIPQTQQKPPI